MNEAIALSRREVRGVVEKQLAAVTLIAFCLGIAAPLLACTCFPPTPLEAYDRCSIVIGGEILSADEESVPPYRILEVRVDFCWKGEVQPGQVVRAFTLTCNGCCVQKFEVGESYVFFCAGERQFYTDVCFGNIGLGPATFEILPEPGCSVATESRTWSMVKRLFTDF